MLIIELLINENLNKIESDLNRADSGNIVELCRKYAQILSEYRENLYKLRGSTEINLQPPSPFARELIGQVRRAIRLAVEITARKYNKTELLLESFTSISVYEAVKTFNRLGYKGFYDWELGGNTVFSQRHGKIQQIAIPEAVDAASLLRREAYIADRSVFFEVG